MKVMVVEDSRAIRERLVAMLEGIVGRLSLIEAGTVSEAIEGMHRHQPDVVVLDLQLPDGHGLDLLVTIRALNASTQVLIITADPFDWFKKRAVQLGASDFLDKTKEFDKVVGFVAKLVDEAKARR